jgi:hypothetical protein
MYRVSQKERSIFKKVIASVFLSRKFYMYMCPIPKGSEIQLFHCTVPKLLIRKRYFVLFLIPIFNVQVTKLVVNINAFLQLV